MEMAQGHWLAACQGFEKVRGYLLAPGLQPCLKQVDLWLADCYGQLGNRDQQIDALRRAVRTDPFSGVARANLAHALLAAGSIDEATKEYRELMDMSQGGSPRSASAGPPAGPQESSTTSRRARLGDGGEDDRCCRKGVAGFRGDSHAAGGGFGRAKPLGRCGGGVAASASKAPKEAEICRHARSRWPSANKTGRRRSGFWRNSRKLVGDSVD